MRLNYPGESPLGVLREYLENKKWHFTEAADGSVLICLDSLLKGI